MKICLSGRGIGKSLAMLMIMFLALFVFTLPVFAHGPGPIPILPVVTTVSSANVGPYLKGNLELKAPTWNSHNGYIDNWKLLEIGGDARLYNVFGKHFPLNFFISGEHTAGTGFNKWVPLENKLKAGIEYKLGDDVTFFSYWDRRFNADIDRVFCGIRLGFDSRSEY